MINQKEGAWAEIAEHYRSAMLSAEMAINSTPMPVSDGQTSLIWKRFSEAATGLHTARMDMIHKYGPAFLNSGPIGPAALPAVKAWLIHWEFTPDSTDAKIWPIGRSEVVLTEAAADTMLAHLRPQSWVLSAEKTPLYALASGAPVAGEDVADVEAATAALAEYERDGGVSLEQLEAELFGSGD